ncbi:FAD-dependent oxidoreductase [Pseudophaeobacter arcticus]|jgi:thioredoxin reductase
MTEGLSTGGQSTGSPSTGGQSTGVLIVGAGPAGIRAAETCVKAGLHPIIVDEARQAGGQIYRRPASTVSRSAKDRYGSEAGKALALHKCFDLMVSNGQVTHLSQSSVTAIAHQSAQVLTNEGIKVISFEKLILCTGAGDRLLPVPGWQSAGVFSLGAMQIALKTQEVALGRRLVLAGTGPLLTLVAAQLIRAGAEVAAVLDTAPMRQQVKGAWAMAMARPIVTLRGLYLRAILGQRYHAGVRNLRITTNESGPTQLCWQDHTGLDCRTQCDGVGLGWHLMADTQLADLAGANFYWSTEWSQWLPEVDSAGRLGNGVYLAGDGERILGADAAECAGQIAAAACLEDMGLTCRPGKRALWRHERMQRFASGLATAFQVPQELFTQLPSDTVICRCEGVALGDIQAAARRVGPDINRVKSQCRIGMGRCQGRYCQFAAGRILAELGQTAPAKIGRLRAQPPLRPLPVSAALQSESVKDPQ